MIFKLIVIAGDFFSVDMFEQPWSVTIAGDDH